MKVPLLDLKRQYATIKSEIDAAVMKVLSETQFVLGPEVKEFEQRAANYCGVKHAVGVASGTDALLLSLRACGVAPGDEVITSTFSFFASAGVISRLGAIPIFADIDSDTFNINPASIKKKITKKTKVLMPVHLYGQCADMDSILELAKQYNLDVVEDAAQAIGARYKGRKAGTMGRFGCFSFFPSKNLGGMGDGGMIITNSDADADLLLRLRVHGAKPKYYHNIVGYNSRLDTIQAAVLNVKLNYLDRWTEARREKADIYNRGFAGTRVVTPAVPDYNYHIYHQYTVAVPDRDGLKRLFAEKQIGCDTYYPLPLHLQECFHNLRYKTGDLPVSEKCAREVISLPVFPELTETEQQYVIDTVKEFAR